MNRFKVRTVTGQDVVVVATGFIRHDEAGLEFFRGKNSVAAFTDYQFVSRLNNDSLEYYVRDCPNGDK